MRAIETTCQFTRDFKREAKGRHAKSLQIHISEVITALASDLPLSKKYRDHALTGGWKDHRDCHLKPDLVLIYRKLGAEVLQLVRIGSHSELCL